MIEGIGKNKLVILNPVLYFRQLLVVTSMNLEKNMDEITWISYI